ncbi:unnamed protein product [Rotaria magnacalcarata]|uniref:Uncharacterized protein n=1 Tax=Rotaria magnacalcarata TaxID=392030 RepID=A0A816MAT3_9BILA|nr:unnamed protein product [Rotaria magnacalcarata]CAF2128099.1 unnamed protein product [Rotaria magnacalcarata]
MKFPEIAMTLLNSFKEKGDLQSADAGFIELACEILSDPSYRESFRKYYIIHRPEETMQSDDFNNYQKILYLCNSALTILHNLANLAELKIHFRECEAMKLYLRRFANLML